MLYFFACFDMIFTLPSARWILEIIYKKKKESQLTGRTACYCYWIFLMVISLTGCCSYSCQEVTEGDIHYDEFDDYVELKGVSGDAVFPYILLYDIYLTQCEMGLMGQKEEKVPTYRASSLVLLLNMPDGNSFNGLLLITLPRSGVYYVIVNYYIKLKGVSGNAVFPCMLWYDISYDQCEIDLTNYLQKEERVLTYRKESLVLLLNIPDGNSFIWLLLISLPRSGVHYDIFNYYIKLKGVSGNAVFPCMLWYYIYFAQCEIDLSHSL